MNSTMLIVEDDEGLRPSLELSFKRRGHKVFGVSSLSAATELLRQRNIELVLADIRLPDGSGLDVLTAARKLDTETAVIMMTAFPDVRTAVQAMKDGASDFIVKPFELEELHITVERAMERRVLRRDVEMLERDRERRGEITDLLGESPVVAEVRELIRKVADTNAPVLITGETGTGKELVADAIHRLSSRSSCRLVKANCSAFSEQLLESELFGHEKGAFTGATEGRAGLFEMANGGTLLLDEITELKTDLQGKLLRVVEGQPFRRVGSPREIWMDVRVIATTNGNIPELIRSGAFREDLFFRLNGFQIQVPPLRIRGRDIVLLARAFLERSASALRKGTMRLGPEVEEVLLGYRWPGNVRELRNVMERAAILCKTEDVTVAQLPGEIQADAFVSKHVTGQTRTMLPLSEIDRRYVFHVLENVGGNLTEAARVLGISRNTLRARLQTPGNLREEK